MTSLKNKEEKEGDSRLALKWSKKRDDKECRGLYWSSDTNMEY
jgi:hypothetical protein